MNLSGASGLGGSPVEGDELVTAHGDGGRCHGDRMGRYFICVYVGWFPPIELE